MSSDLSNIKAVIFDMDGLLLDSERVALSTFIESCRECGFEPSVDVYYRCIGVNSARTREILVEGHGKDFPYDAMRMLWHKKYEEEAASRPFPLKTGVLELLQLLQEKGARRVVVTSTRHESALRELARAGLLQFFEFVVGGDQVSSGKPDPEIYLTACRKLGEEPADCLALEDSDNGVLSATAAGLRVIQVPDLLQPSEVVKRLGHRIVGSLAEVERLFRRSSRNA